MMHKMRIEVRKRVKERGRRKEVKGEGREGKKEIGEEGLRLVRMLGCRRGKEKAER